MENSYKRILDRVVLSEESEKKLLAIPDMDQQEKKPEKKIVRLQPKIIAAAAALMVVLITGSVWMLNQRNMSKDAAYEYAEDAVDGKSEKAGERAEENDYDAPQAAGAAEEADGVPAEGAYSGETMAGDAAQTTAAAKEETQAAALPEEDGA